MRARMLTFFLGCFFIALESVAIAQQTGPQNADSTSGPQIDRILAEVQMALLTVQNAAKADNLPQLASVSLELKTEFAYDAQGELKLYVVSADGKLEKQDTQKIVMVLTPPKAGAEQPIAAGDVTERLSNAILAAARGVAATQRRKPPLTLSKLQVEIQFIIKASSSGGIKFDILPITASMKGGISSNSFQTATVTFQTPER